MQLTLRPFATAGIAITAAGVIAVAPLTPATPDVHIAAPRVSSEAVALMVDPITALTNLVNHTVTSLGGLATQFVTPNIAPILLQFVTNQIQYAQVFGNAAVLTVQGLVTAFTTIIPIALQHALAAFQAGNIAAGFQFLSQAVLAPIGPLIIPATNAIQTVLTMVATHLANLANLFAPTVSFTVGALIGPPLAAFLATGVAIQNVTTPLGMGNVTGALINAFAAPIIILDGLLNGPLAGVSAAGVLTPTVGPIGAPLTIRNLIATAIDGPVPSAPAAAAATMTAPKNTVTLNITPSTGGSAPVTAKTATTTALTTAVVPNGHKVTPPVLTTNKTVASDLGGTHQTGKTTKK